MPSFVVQLKWQVAFTWHNWMWIKYTTLMKALHYFVKQFFCLGNSTRNLIGNAQKMN